MKRRVARSASGKSRPPVVPSKTHSFWRWVRWAAVLLLGLGGIGAVCKSLVAVPGETGHLQFLLGFGLIGGAAALTQAGGRSPQVLGAWFAGLSRGQFVALTIGAGAALAGLLYWCGMRQFGGYDHSGVIDAGWRLVQGQRPYRDFPCTLPPAFVLGAGYAFRLFGLSWKALILFTALFSAGTFFWLVWLAVRLFADRVLAMVLALTVQSSSMLLFSYWWYNPITSVSAAVFLLSAALLWRCPAHQVVRWSYLAALALLATMKPNMAGGCIILVSIVLLCSKRRRWLVLFLSAGAFSLFLPFLWVNHMSLFDVLKGYLAVRQYGASSREVAGLFERMSPAGRWLTGLEVLGVLLPAMAAVFMNRWRFFKGCARIGLSGIMAATHPFLANGDFKLVDLVPALIGSVLVAAELAGDQMKEQPVNMPSPTHRLILGVLLLVGVTGTGLAIGRDRVKSIGYGQFFEYGLAPKAVPDGFFKGLRTGPGFQETLVQVKEALKTAPGGTVFFGPRMEWGYAAFQRPSPLGQPIIFAPGAFFARSEMETYVASFALRHFDLAVFSRSWDAMGYYPTGIFRELGRDYACDEAYSHLVVGRRGLNAPDSGNFDLGKWADYMVPAIKYTWLAEIHLARGEMAEAVAQLQEATKPESWALQATADLAWIRATAVEPEFRNGLQAVALAKQGCVISQYQDSSCVRSMSVAYAEAGRFDDAITMATRTRALALAAGDKDSVAESEQFIELFRKHVPYRSKPPYVWRHCRLANEHLERSETSAAAAEYQKALDVDPDALDALIGLAWIRATAEQAKLRNAAEAVQLAESACKAAQDKKIVAIWTLSIAYAEAGRFDEALITAARGCGAAQAIADNDGAVENEQLMRLFLMHARFRDRAGMVLTHCQLANDFLTRGETQAAITELQEALSLDAKALRALTGLAWIRATAEQPEFHNGLEAMHLARRACELTRYQDAPSVKMLAIACAETGQFEAAADMAARACDLTMAAGDKERAARSEGLMRLFQAHYPFRANDYPLVHCQLAKTCIGQGELLTAAAELQEALTLDPNLPLALYSLAWIRATAAEPELRNGAQAVQLAEQACKLTHYADADSVATLGASYAETGRFDEAVAMAAKARELALAAGENEQAASIEEAMRLFKAHMPYREKANSSGSK